MKIDRDYFLIDGLIEELCKFCRHLAHNCLVFGCGLQLTKNMFWIEL